MRRPPCLSWASPSRTRPTSPPISTRSNSRRLFFLLGSRRWRDNAARTKIPHNIPVDLVVMYNQMQEGVAHLGRGDRLLIVHLLQRFGAIAERFFQRLTNFGLLFKHRRLLFGH